MIGMMSTWGAGVIPASGNLNVIKPTCAVSSLGGVGRERSFIEHQWSFVVHHRSLCQFVCNRVVYFVVHKIRTDFLY